MFSAGGYDTELLSRIVGSEGEVIAYNNPPYASFAAKEIAARYAGNRLSNVRQITSEVDELTLAPGSLDGAIFVKAYHDMYWRPADGAWNRTDPKVMLSKLHAALKDGGVVVVQDHVAKPGGDAAEIVEYGPGSTPAVRRDFEAAGFKFDGESGTLKHETDNHTKLGVPFLHPGQDRPVHLPVPQGCPLTATAAPSRLAMWSGPRNVSTALMRSWVTFARTRSSSTSRCMRTTSR